MLKQTHATPPPTKRGRGRPRKSEALKKLRSHDHTERQIIDLEILPPYAILRDWAVAQLLMCSRSTVWRYAKMGKIPPPVKAGDHLTGWRAGDIKAYLESLQPAPMGLQIQAAVNGAKQARQARQAKP